MLILFCKPLYALQLDGIIEVSKSGISLTNRQDSKIYFIEGANTQLRSQLKKLRTGDFVSVEAQLKTIKNLPGAVVRSINFVGLQTLIGTWHNVSEPFCYTFVNYNQFTVSKRLKNDCNETEHDSDYSYIINPDVASWVFLVSGERNSYVGELKVLGTERLEINLYDSESGDILRKLNLRRFKEVHANPRSKKSTL
jgi:hypothetical protein